MSFHETLKINRSFLMITDIDNTPVIINLKESPLRWLASFKEKNGQYFLDDNELKAGEQFRRDFELAGLLPPLNVNLEKLRVDNTYNANYTSETKVDAQKRLDTLHKALGKELYSLMQDFLGLLLPIESCETKRGWPKRSGKIVIKLALSQLAKLYRLK